MKNYQHELIADLDHLVNELTSDGHDPILPTSLFLPPTGKGFFQMGVPFQEATALGPNPAMKKMGYADDDRCLIVHVDDIGLSQSNVEGFFRTDGGWIGHLRFGDDANRLVVHGM